MQDSSGNAGNAVAAYCAKAGIGCEIFVPEGTSPKKIDMIRAHGAACTIVPGSRDHCADVCRAKVEQEGVYYANHVYNPFFYEGTKTYIYEVFEQLGRIPANLVIPVGNGTLFLGAMYALEHLFNSGVIDRFPQIIALQSQNCDPLLRAAEHGKSRRPSCPRVQHRHEVLPRQRFPAEELQKEQLLVFLRVLDLLAVEAGRRAEGRFGSCVVQQLAQAQQVEHTRRDARQQLPVVYGLECVAE